MKNEIPDNFGGFEEADVSLVCPPAYLQNMLSYWRNFGRDTGVKMPLDTYRKFYGNKSFADLTADRVEAFISTARADNFSEQDKVDIRFYAAGIRKAPTCEAICTLMDKLRMELKHRTIFAEEMNSLLGRTYKYGLVPADPWRNYLATPAPWDFRMLRTHKSPVIRNRAGKLMAQALEAWCGVGDLEEAHQASLALEKELELYKD